MLAIWTNVDNYAAIALESLIDNTVFYTLWSHYLSVFSSEVNDNEQHEDKYNISFLSKRFEADYTKCILFSAFTIEAFSNLMGDALRKEGELSKKFYNQEPTKKVRDILEILSNIDEKEMSEPLKAVKQLFKVRNKLVHDQGKIITDPLEYQKEFSKRQPSIGSADAFHTLIKLDNFLEKTQSKYRIRLVRESFRECWEGWHQKECRYRVSDGLLYEHASFPSLNQYKLMVLRHTGVKPNNCTLDEKNKKIVRIK